MSWLALLTNGTYHKQDLRRFIWADVTSKELPRNFLYRPGIASQLGRSIERAHIIIQTHLRRMLTILRVRMDWGGGPTRRVPHTFPNGQEGIKFVRGPRTNKVFSRLRDAREKYGYGSDNEWGNVSRGIDRTSLGFFDGLPWLPIQGTPLHHHETYF